MKKKLNKDYLPELLLFCLNMVSAGSLYAQKDLVNCVNTLQGTNSWFESSRGNTYPMLAMSCGMNFGKPQTGVNRDGWIYPYFKNSIPGFRRMHQCLSRTNDYAAFSFMPISVKLVVDHFKRVLKFSCENLIARLMKSRILGYVMAGKHVKTSGISTEDRLYSVTIKKYTTST